MAFTTQARLATGGRTLGWLFAPAGHIDDAGRAFLLGQLLSSPLAALMGSACAATVALAALLRQGSVIFILLVAGEMVVASLRLGEWRARVRLLRKDADHVPAVDMSVLLSTLWCTLQGLLAFTIMSGPDPLLRTLSATLVMAMIGPICARNYAAPRFAFLLILLCDLPFVAGALVSGEPWLAVILPLTPPFLIGATQIIETFHRAMLTTLAAEARNRHLAQHDSLTGVLNRQGMDEVLSRIVPAGGRQMALISIDLDGFKQVNDRHGHGAGDLLLIAVAERISRRLREKDLFGRMGGDEFMIIVRDMPADDIGPLADRLIAAISHPLYDLGDGRAVRVGASIGFACLPEDAASTVELRLRADQALYAAKGAGKGVGRRFEMRSAAA